MNRGRTAGAGRSGKGRGGERKGSGGQQEKLPRGRMLLTALLHGGEIWNAYLTMPQEGVSGSNALLDFEAITGAESKRLRLSREAPSALMKTLRSGQALDRATLQQELEQALAPMGENERGETQG